jgi:hypothetical protein
MAERQALHAYLSQEAHAAWMMFAEENGVSVTGLLEALGLEIDVELAAIDAHEVRQSWVRRARKIDAERRRRGR